ncbi:beta-sandwich lipoprotein [Kineosporia succinea]|uniref:Lipoprotein n=1 Tax=Kineosporia succinea TaxID=84632 RepID=A0ABT9P9J5_9ACTN|nr:hypothetical protein [Kineosporia succinea]MDP9829371.1 hypothetical protein [Kineosporia succinea]
MKSKRRTAVAAAIMAGVAAFGLSACTTEAESVNDNLSKDADNFKVARKITFVNGITDKVILEAQGLCSVDPGDGNRMFVTCKDSDGKYVRHSLGKSDNVFWFVEQLEATNTSTSAYRFVVRPDSLIPEVSVEDDDR